MAGQGPDKDRIYKNQWISKFLVKDLSITQNDMTENDAMVNIYWNAPNLFFFPAANINDDACVARLVSLTKG